MHCGLEKGKVKMPFSSGEIQDIAELNCSFNNIGSCHPCGWSCVDDDVSQKASLRLELSGETGSSSHWALEDSRNLSSGEVGSDVHGHRHLLC